MEIEIDCGVDIPRDAPRIVKDKATRKLPTATRKPIEAFQEAYKAVYGLTPEVKFEDGFFRIKGHEGGVTKPRLREMTHQLRWRLG